LSDGLIAIDEAGIFSILLSAVSVFLFLAVKSWFIAIVGLALMIWMLVRQK
jgi:hypothetical protein